MYLPLYMFQPKMIPTDNSEKCSSGKTSSRLSTLQNNKNITHFFGVTISQSGFFPLACGVQYWAVWPLLTVRDRSRVTGDGSPATDHRVSGVLISSDDVALNENRGRVVRGDHSVRVCSEHHSVADLSHGPLSGRGPRAAVRGARQKTYKQAKWECLFEKKKKKKAANKRHNILVKVYGLFRSSSSWRGNH